MASRAIIDYGTEAAGSEKRVWFRTRPIYRLVTVRVKGQQSFAKVRNISDGGICLEAPVTFCCRDRVEVFFANDLSLRGRVAWADGGDCGIQFDTPVCCRDLLAQATQYCLRNIEEPLTLRVNATVSVITDAGEVRTTLREVSPLCLRLDVQPELCAGRNGTITLPSGASRRGVVRRAENGICTFLLCAPFDAHELGQFSRTLNHDNVN